MSRQPSLAQKFLLAGFGITCFVIVLEIGLRLGGLAFFWAQKYRNTCSIRQKGAYRIMCLGESTTANQYPAFLEEALNKRQTGMKFSVIDRGRPGTDTTAILESLEANLDEYHPDMVITMMGINDGGTHMPHEAVSDPAFLHFLKSFRVYKLARLCGLHISARLEDARRHAVESDPANSAAHINLGVVYRNLGRLAAAEAEYTKALRIAPGGEQAYVELAWVYWEQRRLKEAEAALTKALELVPSDAGAHVQLARIYREQGRFAEAEALCRQAVTLAPDSAAAYLELGWVFLDTGKLLEVEAACKKAIELDPRNDRAYLTLAAFYRKNNDLTLAKEFEDKARKLGSSGYSAVTAGNYLKLKAVLDKRGVRYVCMQYPMRPIEPLKKIFRGETAGMIFVENEKVFKDAVQDASYREYFVDMFGGDFGHCTKKGNTLLGENAASVISQQAFCKQDSR